MYVHAQLFWSTRPFLVVFNCTRNFCKYSFAAVKSASDNAAHHSVARLFHTLPPEPSDSLTLCPIVHNHQPHPPNLLPSLRSSLTHSLRLRRFWRPRTPRCPPSLDSLGLRPLNMMRGNPTLIVSLSPTRHRRSISAQHTDLVTRVDFLASTGGTFRALAAFSVLSFLREECRDPGAVDEVASSGENGGEEEVEEDATQRQAVSSFEMNRKVRTGKNLQLRIKKTRIRLHNTNRLIISRNLIQAPHIRRQHCRNRQS